MKKILFISNNSIGSGLSGGDNIFIQLMKGWSRVADVTLIGSEEAADMARRRGAGAVPVVLSDHRNDSPNPYTIPGLFRHYVRRLKKGLVIFDQKPDLARGADVMYSASDAYPDFVPAWRWKKRRPELLWIAGYYLFAPPPFHPDSPYRGKNWLRGLLYWVMQIPSYWLVNRYADVVFVTSEPDVKRFVTAKRNASRVVVVRGGVDTGPSEAYLRSGAVVPVSERPYHACFIGRLHYQKGVLELVEIWKRVTAKRPDARLAMIGDGPLEQELRDRIAQAGLGKNVDVLGFLDGEKKFEVFRKSRVVVHPATYDSGGMAAAEAMAWGLPAVSFDLEALQTYYPKGMLKARPGDMDQFAAHVLHLLEDPVLYARMAEDALDLIRREWEWGSRAESIYQQAFSGGLRSEGAGCHP